MTSMLKVRSGWISMAVVVAGLAAPDGHCDAGKLNRVYSQLFPSGNLLENGSFEGNYSSTHFESWAEGPVHDADAYGQVLFSDVVPPRSGRRYAGIRFEPPAAASRFLVSNPFQVKPNTWYTFIVHYRTIDFNPASGQVFASFRAYKDRDALAANNPDPFATAAHGKGDIYTGISAWTQYAHRFFTGGSANYANVALLSADGVGIGGAFFFDDAYLVEGCVRVAAGETLPADCLDNVAFGLDPRHPDSIGISQKFFNSDEKPIQKLVQDGPRDIVTQTFFDSQGRAVKTTLPIGAEFPTSRHQYVPNITTLGDASDVLAEFYDPSKNVFIDEPIAGVSAKYPDASRVAYSENFYEVSALGRLVEAGAPGAPWAIGGGHSVSLYYSSVPDLGAADDETLPLPETSPPNGEFFVKMTTGSDGQITREFTDRLGRTVRTSSKLRADWVVTDYRYDGFGNLESVLAPQDATGHRLTTTMTYNPLGQTLSESTPATGTTRFLYDAQGRIRFSQSANQAAATQSGAGRFSYLKYDALGREVQSGEITDASLFREDKAEAPEFPCVSGCIDPISQVAANLMKVRTKKHYDEENSALSCSADGGGGSSGSGNGPFRFLAKDFNGNVISATFDLVQAYEEAAALLLGQSGTATILALYDPIGETEIEPRPGSEIQIVGNLSFSLEALSLATQSGADALAAFAAFQARQASTLAGPGEFLQGRLVKSLTCNYELAEALGEGAPREVSKTYRYDKYGNVTRVLEINRYAREAKNQVQLTKSAFDVQNRLVEKIVCPDLHSDPLCIGPLAHVEKYRYDRLGRLFKVLDKAGNTIIQNHYNFIGQLSARTLGGNFSDLTGNGLIHQNAFHLHGGLQHSVFKLLKPPGTELFKQELQYEGSGGTGRFDGSISSASYFYGAPTSLGTAHYEYAYDDLNRLVSSDVDPSSTIADASSFYDYLDDGRIAMISRGARTGGPDYDPFGRLTEVTGNLVPGRDMTLATHGDFVFDYDNGGNMITDNSKQKDGQPLEIFYRADNLPYMFVYKDSIPSGGFDLLTVYMAYDEGGRRVTKEQHRNNAWNSSKNYYSSGKEVRERKSGSAVIGQEVFAMAGGGRVTYASTAPQGFKEYFLADHLGTTRESYDLTTGELTYASHYFPYGKQFSEFVSTDKGDVRMATEGVTEKFTGKELDEGINLMYFGARYYDADLAMWISPDPMREFHSPYAYTHGDPINFMDYQGLYEMPINNAYLTSAFGPRGVSGGSSNHKGIDLRASSGTGVMALGPGYVHDVIKSKSYGNVLITSHRGGAYVMYAHLSKIDVKKGQQVTEGMTVGKTGNSGVNTLGQSHSPHLHFEVILNTSDAPTYSDLLVSPRVNPFSVNVGDNSNLEAREVQLEEIHIKSGG